MKPALEERVTEVRQLARAEFRRAARQAVYVLAIAGGAAGATLGWHGLTLAAILVWLDFFAAGIIRLAGREWKRR